MIERIVADSVEFIETPQVTFDEWDFAIHKPCGERLVETWKTTEEKEYILHRSGTLEYATSSGPDRECDGVQCHKCLTVVFMRTKARTPRCPCGSTQPPGHQCWP